MSSTLILKVWQAWRASPVSHLTDHALHLVEARVPREGDDQVTPGTGQVRLDALRSLHDPNAFGTQRFHAAPVRFPAGERGIYERQDENRDTHPGQLRQH